MLTIRKADRNWRIVNGVVDDVSKDCRCCRSVYWFRYLVETWPQRLRILRVSRVLLCPDRYENKVIGLIILNYGTFYI